MSQTTLAEVLAGQVKLTPMMIQYKEVKEAYADHIVLFRMGDFYEVFFEDARLCSQILNITLTHRGKLGEFPIPMAGIPHHAASSYVDRLANSGHKVAICEQISDPKDSKGIVKRAVTQVVSPGIPYDLDKSDADKNFIAVGSKTDKELFLVAVDFTTGEFFGQKFKTFDDWLAELMILAPKELITFRHQWESKDLNEWLHRTDTLVTHMAEDYFVPSNTEIYLQKLLPNFKRDKIIAQEKGILQALGALSFYLSSTQNGDSLAHIHPFALRNRSQHLKISPTTLVGLEILPKGRDRYRDSVLGLFDKTKTSGGSRLLKDYFLSPLQNLSDIQKRQNVIEWLVERPEELEVFREELQVIRDIDRIMAKLATKRANGQDLLALAQAADQWQVLRKVASQMPENSFKTLSNERQEILLELSSKIQKTINPEIGASLEKGNLILEGFDSKRDRLAKLGHHAEVEVIKLEERYRLETGIPKLKVKSNNVTGYFIEVSKIHSDKVPNHFERRQTLVNSERYITSELSEFEKELVFAQEKLSALERDIFQSLVQEILDNARIFQELSEVLSIYDVFQSLAHMARQLEMTRPTFIENEKRIKVKGAWHPLIKSNLRDQFIPHDLRLDENIYFGLITGPNMAGKTTVMREMAIIQLLAQIGSFVPAAKAELGICDYLFSRLGASDDIIRGQSTFMVEMAETAEIVRHATKNSLIILDEVGRGTSTYDGLSIAWALVEHFVKKTKALCLFATHYHELIDLANSLPQCKNLTVETRKEGTEVRFLYRLIEAAASQSYGIYVAKLAGLPASILKRSSQILGDLEKDSKKSQNYQGTQLCFLNEDNVAIPQHLIQMEKELRDVNVLEMTPVEALVKLESIKTLMQ